MRAMYAMTARPSSLARAAGWVAGAAGAGGVAGGGNKHGMSTVYSASHEHLTKVRAARSPSASVGGLDLFVQNP